MSALLSSLAPLAANAAQSALALTRDAALATATAFAGLLESAANGGTTSPTDVSSLAEEGEGEDLADRIASRLAELLDFAGAAPGEAFRLIIAPDDGVEVQGASLSLAAVQQALSEDSELVADLAELAAVDFPQDGDQSAALTIVTPLPDEPVELAWS